MSFSTSEKREVRQLIDARLADHGFLVGGSPESDAPTAAESQPEPKPKAPAKKSAKKS